MDDEEKEIKKQAVKSSTSTKTKSSNGKTVKTVTTKYTLKDGSEYTYNRTETTS